MVVLEYGISILKALTVKLVGNSLCFLFDLDSGVGKSGGEGRLCVVSGGEYLARKLVVGAESDVDICACRTADGDSAVGLAVLVCAGGSRNGTAIGNDTVDTEEVNVVVSHLTGKLDHTVISVNEGYDLTGL